MNLADLYGANMRGAQLIDAQIRKLERRACGNGSVASYDRSDQFSGRTINDAFPYNADLTETNLKDAKLTDAVLKGGRMPKRRKWGRATCGQDVNATHN